MTILNPCPFCGGEAILESNKLRYGTIYSAYCQKCGAEITGSSEHEAVATWNRRVQLAEQKGASYWKSAWETQCNENKLLYESLAESQRRERTAVDMCDGCNFKNTVGCHCARAAWRGPQEAGDE